MKWSSIKSHEQFWKMTRLDLVSLILNLEFQMRAQWGRSYDSEQPSRSCRWSQSKVQTFLDPAWENSIGTELAEDSESMIMSVRMFYYLVICFRPVLITSAPKSFSWCSPRNQTSKQSLVLRKSLPAVWNMIRDSVNMHLVSVEDRMKMILFLSVYTKTLDFVIRNLDYPGKLEVYFENLGKRHVAMQGRGFEPGYWETFAECMTQAAVEWEANRQRPTLGAWRNLVKNHT